MAEKANGNGTGGMVANPTTADPAVSLRSFWFTIVKRRWMAATFVLGVVSMVTIYTIRQPKVYKATATLQIDIVLPQVLGQKDVQDVTDTGTNYWSSKEYFLTQYKIITSRAVAERAVDKLRLRTDPMFLGIDKLPPAQREKAAASKDPVEIMRRKVIAEPVRDSRLVFINVEDLDPVKAALYTNTIAEAYIEQNLSQRLSTTRAASKWLQDQMESLKVRVEKSELSVYEFKKENDTLSASMEDKQNIISQRLVALNDELTKLSAKRAELAAKAHQAELAQKASGGDLPDSLTAIVENHLIQDLKLQAAQAQQALNELSERYGKEHPKYAQAEEKLHSIKSTIKREVDKLIASIVSDHREKLEAEQNLRGLIEVTKKEAFELNKKEIEYKKVAREEESNRRLYDIVLKRLKEADLSSMLRTNNIHILDAAQVPKTPVRPNIRLNLLLALLFGVVGAVALAFLLEQLDSSIKGQEDIEQVLGITFLGFVPSFREEAQRANTNAQPAELMRYRDLFTISHPQSSVAECCRTIRTNLLFMKPDRPLRKIMVFSSSQGEGKTTTALSVAIAMAEAGQKTLIVDSDMRRPRLHKTFQVSNSVGLSTAILDDAGLDETIKSTAKANLFVLPSGPIPPNPVELLHAASFERLVEKLSQRFDRIIFDSPPVLAVADAVVMARVMDGSLMVTKAGHTQKGVAARAARSIQDVHSDILGAILNDVDVNRRGYSYHTYYYYRYRSSYYGTNPAVTQSSPTPQA